MKRSLEILNWGTNSPRLGYFVWIFPLGALIWNLSFGIFRLGTFVWDLIFRSGINNNCRV
jgi:hypothetical protein